ncbi:MAG: TIGR01906 family membrane protein, partial [Tepidiformaceae bacterium]
PDLDRAGQDIVDYFENDSSELHILVTQDGQEVSLFNTRETDHMKDVKWLVQIVYRLNEISLAVIIAYVAGVFLWSREKSLRSLAYQALTGVGVGTLFVGIIGAFALTGFNSAWVKFHEIVFRNDLWQLNPATDHLIQMFPEPFWEESTVIVAALTAAEVIVIVALSLGYLIHTRERDSEAPAGPPRERNDRVVSASGPTAAE